MKPKPKLTCKFCGKPLKDETVNGDEVTEEDINFAKVVVCEECFDLKCKEAGFPPCNICHTPDRCDYGECWATPPLHIFPYETLILEVIEVDELQRKLNKK